MQIYDVGNIEPISFIRMHWRVDQASGSNMDCAQANPKNPFIPVDIFSIKIAMQISTEFTVYEWEVWLKRERIRVCLCVWWKTVWNEQRGSVFGLCHSAVLSIT